MAAHPYTHVGGGNGVWSYKIDIDAGAIVSAAEAAKDATLSKLGDYIKAESNAIAPIRDGNLIGSSKSKRISDDTQRISYNIIYAHYQHEGAGFHHPNGGQAFYLRDVMDDPATLQAAKDIFTQELSSRLG